MKVRDGGEQVVFRLSIDRRAVEVGDGGTGCSHEVSCQTADGHALERRVSHATPTEGRLINSAAASTASTTNERTTAESFVDEAGEDAFM